MDDLHEKLWTVCRKLPTDFQPYGNRDRDTAEPSEDCSCGCRHFVPLHDPLGFDWGVCANENSPRAGLLTFEHQGCPEFEAEETVIETIAQPPEVPAEPEDSAPAKTVTVNWIDLDIAFEHFDSGSGIEMEHFLDTETGEVVCVCSEGDDYEERSAQVESNPDRYVGITPLESHEHFQIMESFAASMENSRVKSRLKDALSRNKPFRRFKDVVHSDLKLRNRWFAFRQAAMIDHARSWLKGRGINANIIRPVRES